MNDYIELRVDLTPCDEAATDVLAALLAEHGYESFVPDDGGLTAYVREPEFNAGVLRGVIDDMPFEGITNWARLEFCAILCQWFATFTPRLREPQ